MPTTRPLRGGILFSKGFFYLYGYSQCAGRIPHLYFPLSVSLTMDIPHRMGKCHEATNEPAANEVSWGIKKSCAILFKFRTAPRKSLRHSCGNPSSFSREQKEQRGKIQPLFFIIRDFLNCKPKPFNLLLWYFEKERLKSKKWAWFVTLLNY